MPFAENFDVLALIGFTLVGGFIAGQLFRRLGIPQVVGYILAGVLLGPSFLHLIPEELNSNLNFVSDIALGLIGFEMGGHLFFKDLRRLGKSIIAIVILQALGALLLVGLGTYLITGQLYTALVLGAIATATAPAATIDVLAEYKAEGPVTTTLLAVVGLDDALSLVLFSIAAGLAEVLLGGHEALTLMNILEAPIIELGGSLVVGTVFGLVLSRVMHRVPSKHDAMLASVGVVFLCAGLAREMHLSLILTTMTLGVVVINRNSENSRYIHFTIESAGSVIYVLFFALAGARLRIDLLPAVGLLGIAYIGLRAVGKYGGTWLGGTWSGAEPPVTRYLGLALLSQAGVAIGLSLECCLRFGELGTAGAELANTVLNIVTSTMLVVQVIGPILVKYVIVKAGEAKALVADQALAESPTPISEVG